MVKIITIYPNFSVQGGAQNVAFQLAEKLNDTSEIIILTDTPQKLIHSQYKRKGVVFLSFSWKNVRILAREQNCIFYLIIENQLQFYICIFRFLVSAKK